MRSRQEPDRKAIIQTLFAIEQLVSHKANRFGCRFRLSPATIRDRFEALPVTELVYIKENISRLAETFDLCATENTDPWNDLEFLRLSMRQLGLTYAADFSELVQDGDLIEGYDMNRRQNFRNLKFMETSNYSLMELLAYDWPMLFHRAQDVTEVLIQQAERDLWSGNQTIRSEAPRHVVREILCSTTQAFEVYHKYFVPLYSGPDRPAGVLSVCEGRPMNIEVSIDRGRLAFI